MTNIRSQNGYINIKKMHFKPKYYQGQRETFHNDKRVNSSEKYDNYKCICTYKQSPKIHEAKSDIIERKNRKQKKDWRLK